MVADDTYQINGVKINAANQSSLTLLIPAPWLH
jgi:hypothetical protein